MTGLRQYFDFAVKNIAKWGDTDVFPFAPENHILHDSRADVVDLLMSIHTDFEDRLQADGPLADVQLQLVTNEGFRWATQLDPLWNAYLLGIVLSAADGIESRRLPAADSMVFSYRYAPDRERGTLFQEGAWLSFIDATEAKAQSLPYVVVADISDFYGRIYHHRIENSVSRAMPGSDIARRIDKILSAVSGGVSFGLPVGGPAARVLSEAVLSRVDLLLAAEGVEFCRYADDYRIFAKTESQAYGLLVRLASLLHMHEGATLQKQKTRVVRSRDFLRAPLFLPRDSPDLTPSERREKKFMRLSLRYDPYSENAELDYIRLREQLSEFDIIGMLSDEVAKSRVNLPVVRRLAQAIGHVDGDIRDAAISTMIDNLELLAPALPVVLRVLDDLMGSLSDDLSAAVATEIRRRLEEGSYYLDTAIIRTYAFRVLRHQNSQENVRTAVRSFDAASPGLQRDLAIHLHNWEADWYVSDLRRRYSSLHPWVRRAVLLSSYSLKDEGAHWRRAQKPTEFDAIALKWRQDQMTKGKKEIPL